LISCILIIIGIAWTIANQPTNNTLQQELAVRLLAAGITLACVVFSMNIIFATTFVIRLLDYHITSTTSQLTPGSANLSSSLNRLVRFRRLAGFIIFSLLSMVGVFWIPALLDYVFPVIVTSGMILLILGLFFETGIPAQSNFRSHNFLTSVYFIVDPQSV
jgi:hypothetical protein